MDRRGASSHLMGRRPAQRRGRALHPALIAVGVLCRVTALAVAGALYYVMNRYGGKIDRVAEVFAGLSENSRPAAPAPDGTHSATLADPVTLLVGSDPFVASPRATSLAAARTPL